MSYTVAIVGASGYSGAELLRLLARRADVRISYATAASSVGQKVEALYPWFRGSMDLTFTAFDADQVAGADVALIALPSGEALSIVPALQGRVGRIIDLGGDFRLKNSDLYAQYYKRQHTAPELLEAAVYGLPELNKEEIADATLVANPGCYPTSALLALLPALQDGMIAPDNIIINSLSGVSGAGRSANIDLSFAEMNGNVRAYRIGHHQHIPEIESVLSAASGKNVSVSFVPHLAPVTRGIYTTVTAQLAQGQRLDTKSVLAAYRDFYAQAPFVRTIEQVPELRGVVGSNYCDISVMVDHRTKLLIIVSAIDNLVKGAAGQAVQNMNIMLGLPEDCGLR